MSYLQNEFRQPGSFLIPLRLFIGIYFVLASVNKFFDSQWHIGITLTNILQRQLQTNDIIFPFYESFVSTVLIPNAELVSGIVLFLELYSGLAILFGVFTNLALISGIALYINLLLFGKIHPSLLLIVSQTVLLGMNIGAILGFDKVLSRRISSGVLVAQRERDLQKPKSSRFVFVTLAIWFFLFTLLSLSYSQNLMAKLLEDTTLLLSSTALATAALSLMAGLIFLILAIQAKIPNDEDLLKPTLLIQGPAAAPPPQPPISEPIPANMVPSVLDTELIATLRGHSEQSVQMVDTPPTPQPVMDNRTLVNEYSKLIVPHNVEENRTQAVRKLANKQDNDEQEANSPSLRKLYLE